MFNFIRLQLIRIKTLNAYKNGDWKKIPIKENGQSLILVPEELSFPYYSVVMNLLDDKRIFVRREVLEKIFQARILLQRRGFDLKVYDGWRSVELQEKLFWYYMFLFTYKQFGYSESFIEPGDTEKIKDHFNKLSPEVRSLMIETNRTYVSLPTKDALCPSPHSTGGAVDVWLYKNNEAVNLGVPFDWMEKNAGSFYHFKIKRELFLGNDRKICENRNVLLSAMTQAGFSCYGPEIWHFNYGNQMDALVKGVHASYSYIEP